ncbi:MAG: YiiD C-terminal domain-containing protein [Pseudomonadota bacterium]
MTLSEETILDFIEKKIAFVQRMGLKVQEMKPRYVRLSVPLEGNENHIGTMYAGALFTLAEIPGGALFMTTFDSTRYYPVVRDMSIRFRRPARGDVTVELSMSEEEVRRIETEAAENGKSEFVLNGELKDKSGEIVALSRGVYQLRAIGN